MDENQIYINSVFEAMSSNYESIFMVDLEKGEVSTYRRNPKLSAAFWDYVDTNPPYEELMRNYVLDRVVAEDQERMLEYTSLKMIRFITSYQTNFSCDYRLKNKDGMQDVWYRIRFSKMSEGEELTRFAVSFENVSEERKYDTSFFKQGRKILVVTRKEEDREFLCRALEKDFKVLAVSNSKEGLNILEREYEDLEAILTDCDMPVNDGVSFLSRIHGVRRYGSIPMVALSQTDDSAAEIQALERGAADFIHKPFHEDIIRNRVKSLVRLRTSSAMMNTKEKDTLTGLYTKEFFFKYVDTIMQAEPDQDYWILVSDIEKFKVINDKYGVEKGDEVLRHIASKAKTAIPGMIIGGRISGDIFVYLQVTTVADKKQGRNILKELLKDAPVPNLVMKFGMYHAEPSQRGVLSVQGMCDRARLAMESIKGVYDKYCSIYNDKIREDLLQQQQIIASMDDALATEQFQVYLQPKYDVQNNQVGGAEALVRWIHPELGFMSPGVFIPLFEKNDFIKELDQYVITQVCRILKQWKEEGKKLVPVSVNLSRRDFEITDLAERFTQIVDEHEIEHDLIHVELTESAFSENPEQITTTVKKLHDSGFAIELDDFGTGYSSMTFLNRIEVDYLKLDMSIIQNDVPGSERNVLDFCMQLAKMMNLQTVAEGAETIDQTERLIALGCNFVQGYYYSRPLTLEQFQNYLAGEA